MGTIIVHALATAFAGILFGVNGVALVKVIKKHRTPELPEDTTSGTDVREPDEVLPPPEQENK